MTETYRRQKIAPIDLAIHIAFMLEHGVTSDTIRQRTGISKGGFSELSRIGRHLLTMDDDDRRALKGTGAVTRALLVSLLGETTDSARYRELLRARAFAPRHRLDPEPMATPGLESPLEPDHKTRSASRPRF